MNQIDVPEPETSWPEESGTEIQVESPTADRMPESKGSLLLSALLLSL